MWLLAFVSVLLCVGQQTTPSSHLDSFGIFVGGQYYADKEASQTLQPSGVSPPTPHAPLNGLGQWSSRHGSLQPLGDGVFSSGIVERMVRNETSVIVVGSFQWTRCQPRSCSSGSTFSNQMLRNLAVYNFTSSEWSGVGLGCAGYVNDVALYKGTIIAGGIISECYNPPGVGSTPVLTTNVVQWSEENGWQDLGGQHFAGSVTSLAVDAKTGYIYAVGNSDLSEVNPFIFLKVFDGQRWNIISQLGVGLQTASFSVVRCFGGTLYVGGSFQEFPNCDSYVSNIVSINAADLLISAMNGGVTGPVFDVVEHPGGVLAGGSFQSANHPQHIVEVNDLALYSTESKTWSAFGDFHEGMGFELDWAVRSLDVLQDGTVVASGTFDRVGANHTGVSNVAVYDPASQTWGPVGNVGSDATLGPYTMTSSIFTGSKEALAFGYSGVTGDNVLASYLEKKGWVFEPQALLQTGNIECTTFSVSCFENLFSLPSF